MNLWFAAAAAAALLCLAAPGWGEEREDLLTLRNTMVGIIERLVAQGVLSEQEAADMISRAENEAAEEAAGLASVQPSPEAMRVSYVPQVVRDQIRDEVKADLRREVVQDVLDAARQDAWGVPGALPAWLSDLNFTADMRIRSESVLFDGGNQVGFYRDFQAINAAGGLGGAGQSAFLNVDSDRNRLLARLRLGVNMRIAENWLAGLRLTTGNDGNPVSRNATLSQAGDAGDFDAVVDLAYLHYGSDYFLFTGGRMPNPFVHSQLTWDSDLTFEGVSMTAVLPFGGAGADGRVFATAGAFPLEEIERSSADKWLYGGQLGVQVRNDFGASVSVAGSYYDFHDVTGRLNAPESNLLDFTAPQFVQKGNTLFDIRNDTDPNTSRFALAADYDIVNATVMLDSGPVLRAPGGRALHVRLSADLLRNIGWDDDDIARRTGITSIGERTDGYQYRIDIGRPLVRERGDFTLGIFYRSLERDAFIDAFASSDFHGGGTDAEGWGLESRLALSRNVTLDLTYLSANEIDGPPLAIDTLQVDLSARF